MTRKVVFVTVKRAISVPEGATHFSGDLISEDDCGVRWLKCKIINEMPHWFFWGWDRKHLERGWFLDSHGDLPHRAEELKDYLTPGETKC